MVCPLMLKIKGCVTREKRDPQQPRPARYEAMLAFCSILGITNVLNTSNVARAPSQFTC